MTTAIPHLMSDLDGLRATRRSLRLHLRDAQRAERLTRLALRRTQIMDDPAILTHAREQHGAALDATEALSVELAAVQRAVHDLTLTSLTRVNVGSRRPIAADRVN